MGNEKDENDWHERGLESLGKVPTLPAWSGEIAIGC
jgi:hypothetical protein